MFHVFWISDLGEREVVVFTHQDRYTSGTLRSGKAVISEGYFGCDVKCKISDYIHREQMWLSKIIM
jgi:hypothetical protein